MGKGSVIELGPDKYQFDLDYWFPTNFSKVGISATGGLDTAAIMVACVMRYGADNVHLFHHRHMQTHHMKRVAAILGIDNIHVVRVVRGLNVGKDRFAEIMWKVANGSEDIDVMYFGMNAKQYPREFTLQHQRDLGAFLPFYNSEKSHTIDLLIKLGAQQLIPDCFSCHVQKDVHCGWCSHCIERKQGFVELSIPDPTIYNTEVRND